jgi:hypothetical protein
MSPLHSKAIVSLSLVLALAGIGCGSDETPKAEPPGAAPTPAPTPPREAAAPAAEATAPAVEEEVIEWSGELPSDFPGDVPQYPDSKVTDAKGTNDLGLAVVFDTRDTPETVSKFYADSLAAMGWQTQTEPTDEGTMILADKEDRMLQALVHSGGQGTLIEIIVAPAK